MLDFCSVSDPKMYRFFDTSDVITSFWIIGDPKFENSHQEVKKYSWFVKISSSWAIQKRTIGIKKQKALGRCQQESWHSTN